MSSILGIVQQQQQTPIDEDKLHVLCARKNVWDYFGLDREDFLNLSKAKQLQLVRKFYFENLSSSPKTNIDSSIGRAIQNSSGLSMTKIIESGNDRTEMTLSASAVEEKQIKCINMLKNHGFFGTEFCDFSIEKANMPENTVYYVNQGYQSYKGNKKVYYNDVYIIAQIMPLAMQPKDIENYQLKDDEVKILRARYDPISGEFLGIEYCVGSITVRNDADEQFFDYGYNKDNSKLLYSTKKLKIPSSSKSTVFSVHNMQYEGGAFAEQNPSEIFLYLPSTVDRSEKINKYLTPVHLKPFHVERSCLGKNFNPADFNFDRAAVVAYMKRVAEQSSQNLKRNADAFLSSVNHDNEKLLWPGGKRTKSDKFALTY